MSIIDKAVKLAGGTSAMASALSVSPQVVANWKGRKSVPAEYCLRIEQATNGKVTRYQLRPDVFGSAPEREAA